eukprot:CAMPEP_0180616250 /NCGR_PEP_ID=MMETSP1037_2-20121125/32378_1 /TAXON_ID=632150 /ORGANISM="Azadinium spinosum, Strain 3D9" /LENGTH=374 /DNA_ID=CAMNT_0022636073 /DNA_START=21 /DNA_END=1142 /DNA_ORIENTATION=-
MALQSEQDLEAARQKIKQLEDELQHKSSEIEEARCAFQDLGAERDQFRGRLAEREHELEGTRQQLERDAELHVEELRRMTSEAEEAHGASQHFVVEADELCKKLSETREKSDAAVEELEHRLARTGEELEIARQEFEVRPQLLAVELAKQLVDARQRLEVAEMAHVIELQRRLDEVREVRSALEREGAKDEEMDRQLREENQDLARRFISTRKELEGARQNLEQETELHADELRRREVEMDEEARITAKRFGARVEELKLQLGETEEELELTRQKLQHAEEALVEELERRQRQAIDAEDLNRRLVETDHELEATHEKLERAEEECVAARRVADATLERRAAEVKELERRLGESEQERDVARHRLEREKQRRFAE